MASSLKGIPQTIHLHYFNGRARGELIRYILNHAQVPFTDNRIDRDHWVQIKEKFPTKQVPVLEYTNDDGKVKLIVQSVAIARACARWFDLDGQTSDEKIQADEAHDCMREIADTDLQILFVQDAKQRAAAYERVRTETVPRLLTYLEKKLESNGTGFIAGGKSFTYGDLAVAFVLDHLSRDVAVKRLRTDRPPVLDLEKLAKQFPGILALKKRVEDSPGIKAYLESRPETEF